MAEVVRGSVYTGWKMTFVLNYSEKWLVVHLMLNDLLVQYLRT